MPFYPAPAKSANRNKRLDIPTIPDIPRPTKSETSLETTHELVRFPSWMENSNDPFGTDVISRPNILSNSTAASVATMSTGDVSSRPNTSSSSEDSTSLYQQDQNYIADRKLRKPRPRSTIASTSAGARIQASHKRSASMRPLSFPTSPIIGEEASPTLSVFGTFPDARRTITKRFRRATTTDNVPVVLPLPLVRKTSRYANAPQKISISNSYSGLHALEIPISPFDPLGDKEEFPFERSNGDDGRSASGSHSEDSDRTEKGPEPLERIIANSEVAGEQEPEARCKEGSSGLADDNGGIGGCASSSSAENPPLTVKRGEYNECNSPGTPTRRPSLAQRYSSKVSGSLSRIHMPSISYSFYDKPCLSLSMFKRQTSVDTGSPRSSTPSSPDSDSQYSQGSGYGDNVDGVLEVHMTDASRHAQESHAPTVMSEHASPELESGPSGGIFFPVDEAAIPAPDSQIQHSDRKHLRKTVISKLRQLVHL